jgi:hypothetical protein
MIEIKFLFNDAKNNVLEGILQTKNQTIKTTSSNQLI